MKKKFLAPLLLASFLTTAQAGQELKDTISLTTVNDKKIDLVITDTGFDFPQYKGKAVLIDFFGPHCPPCLIEMPHIVELQEKRKNDLVVVGVQVQSAMKPEALQAFMKTKKINYPVVNLDHAMELVQFIQTNTNWGGQIPFMLLFNKDGKLVNTYLGVTETSKIESDMKK